MSTIVEDGVFRLLGKVQNYDWGGYTFIPNLIGISPEPGVPYAEYWMGAHEKAPSQILQSDGTIVSLNDILKRQPEKLLGKYVAQVYGRLPFLFKVLDVREMLSIQVHPTKSAAEAGFVRENEMGIPLDSPSRNYKDDNHKPEIQFALSDFWLLQGFLPKNQLCEVLSTIPEFLALKNIFLEYGYLGLYKYVMEMPQGVVNAMLNPLVGRILPKYISGELEKSSPDYWAAKAVGEKREVLDRGIFSIYFFNLVKLKPGQASFQDAGIPHALLQGQCLEIMANSDNVIRGGLTPKHIDVPQLLKLITFKGLISEVSEGEPTDNPHESLYESTSREFRLSRIQLGKGDLYQNKAYSTEILLLLSGEILLESRNNKLLAKKGESIVLFAEENYQIEALSQDVLLFKASVPIS
jgi:mannose-6-phosphate isomerase